MSYDQQLADAHRENDTLRESNRTLREEMERTQEAVREALAGMREMAEKLATVAIFLGFHSDDPKEVIAEKVRALNVQLATLRRENAGLSAALAARKEAP